MDPRPARDTCGPDDLIASRVGNKKNLIWRDACPWIDDDFSSRKGPMKNTLTVLCAVTLLLGSATFAAAQDRSKAAQQSKEVQQNTKTTTANRTTKTSTDIVYGRTETFEAGKSIKVTVLGKIIQTKSF